jgi:hypothetical protein
MKKIITFLAITSLAASSFGQVITQSGSQTISPTGSVACGSQANGYTADNSYMRVFKLSDYGITYDYKITNVSFGVQSANTSFPVEVSIYNYVGAFPSGTATILGASNVQLTAASTGTIVDTGTALTATVTAGSTFVVEVYHNGDVDPPQAFYMGTNASNQTGPSYLASETCGILTPTATGTGGLAAFSTARWVMSVTGVNATLGLTEVLNSAQLQIYPNPVKDVLNFKLSDGLKVESVEIYDIAGKQVNYKNSNLASSIDIAGLAKGNYILRVKANDGKVHIQKIIKE